MRVECRQGQEWGNREGLESDVAEGKQQVLEATLHLGGSWIGVGRLARCGWVKDGVAAGCKGVQQPCNAGPHGSWAMPLFWWWCRLLTSPKRGCKGMP